MKIKFKDYTGEYPNLCSGILTVHLDGKEISFGDETFLVRSKKKKPDYPGFWKSGGRVSFDKEWNADVSDGPWKISSEKPDYQEEIWNALPEILSVMNENVPFGCCGGCV